MIKFGNKKGNNANGGVSEMRSKIGSWLSLGSSKPNITKFALFTFLAVIVLAASQRGEAA